MQPRPRRHPTRRLVAALAIATLNCPLVSFGQISLTGSAIVLKSRGSTTLGDSGYLGTYLTIPAGGATVNLTINATAAAGGTPAPHMNLAIADKLVGFSVNSAVGTNYTTPQPITLPAGT